MWPTRGGAQSGLSWKGAYSDWLHRTRPSRGATTRKQVQITQAWLVGSSIRAEHLHLP